MSGKAINHQLGAFLNIKMDINDQCFGFPS